MSTAPATVQAAQLLLQQLGVSIDDLRRTPVAVPTIAEYLPTVIAASGAGARRTYGSYWNRILTTFGPRRLDQIAPTELQVMMRQAMDTPVRRRNHRGGVCAGEHLLAAMRAIYAHAVADHLVPADRNPAACVRKPRRPASERRALTRAELAAIYDAVASGGNDAVLDTILVRLHTETACRRGAAIRLRQNDLDSQWCLVRLREKNLALRWHPVTPTLMAALVAHRDHRGTSTATDPLLRSRDGVPVTARRHDRLWERLGSQLPWVSAQNVATHWLRHTTITWVERHFGYGIARAYAGHTDTAGASTTTYIRGQLPEIAAALVALTGEPHPLCPALPTPVDPAAEPDRTHAHL
ncbi:MAG: site-specific integrase [Actinophytocola sp.]|uniref:tyrosine-type recombinase/integrase n=1 Tax=Actinophytocola sp. TaxID=1872138 RepID=UPI003C716974